MTTTSDIGTLIVATEGILGGRPRIANTRVSVQRIARWYKKGLNAEDIVECMGNVTLAQVYAALAYYHLNRDEIESYLTAEKLAYEQQTANPSYSI